MGSRVDAIRECLRKCNSFGIGLFFEAINLRLFTKTFTEFKGPPDPLRGDEIYRRVRECAKEVLEALFDGQMPVTTSAVAAAGRVQGIGSDYVPSDSASGKSGSTSGYLSSLVSDIRTSVLGDGTDAQYAGHPGATSNFSGPNSGGAGNFGGSNNYSNNSNTNANTNNGGSSGGFGNPNFQDPRNEKSWLQKASQLASSAASALPGFSKSDTNEPLQSGGGGGGGGGGGFSGNNAHSSGTFNRSAFSNPGADSGYSYATNRGANGIHNNNNAYAPSAAPAWNQQQHQQFQQQPQFQQPQQGGFVPDMPPSTNGLGRAGGAMSTGEYEKNIIDSLCEPGGLRPVPAEDKLLELLNSASTLSEEILGNCLLDVLNDEAWQSRTKALIVISRLVKLPDCPAHQRWWAERADVVESLQSDPKAGVRTQAVKTLKAIDPSATGTVVAPAAAPRRAPSGRAWGSEEENAAPNVSGELVEHYTQPVAAPSPAPAPAPEVLDLLDMGDHYPPAPPAPAVVYNPPPAAYAPSSVPSVVSVSSGALSPLSQDDGSDFFGPGMTISNSSTPHAHSTQPVAPQYYGGVAMKGNAGAESDVDSMFAGMSVGSAPAPVPAPAPAPATSSTGFDFLNVGTAAPARAPEVDLFGSLTIADHSSPAPLTTVAAAPSSSAPGMGASRAFQDDFAGLLDMSLPSALPAQSHQFGAAPTLAPAAVPFNATPAPAGGFVAAANGLPAMSPEQHQQFLQYQQFLLHQQQQQQQAQVAPQVAPGAPNNMGLYLTRPVPGPAPGPGPQAHPGHPGYPGPPRGVMPMGGSPQPAIQLRQGASVIAPGMLSHTAERKNIPVAGAPAGEDSTLMAWLFVSLVSIVTRYPFVFYLLQATVALALWADRVASQLAAMTVLVSLRMQ